MDKLTVFVALTALAVALQAVVLLAIFLVLRKTGARLESLATEVKTKVLPTVDEVQTILAEVRPKLQVISEDVKESAAAVRDQIQRVDAAVNDVVDRARLQVIRADELVNRTMDRVEETTDMVHRTVVSPIRQFSGLMQGVSAGLEFFLGRKRRQSRDAVGVPQDELFI